MVRGMHDRGGVHGRGSCMVGGMHGKGCAWQEGAWWEAYVAGLCMTGGMHGRGACVAGEMATAEDGTHPTGIHSCSLYLFLLTVAIFFA